MNGNKLRKLREDKNILQRDLANYLHISTSTIGMYEQGRRDPDNLTLKLIANYFDVSTDYLLDNEDNKYKNELQNIKDDIKKQYFIDDIIRQYFIDNKLINNDEILTKEKIDKLNEFIKVNKKFIFGEKK